MAAMSLADRQIPYVNSAHPPLVLCCRVPLHADVSFELLQFSVAVCIMSPRGDMDAWKTWALERISWKIHLKRAVFLEKTNKIMTLGASKALARVFEAK